MIHVQVTCDEDACDMELTYTPTEGRIWPTGWTTILMVTESGRDVTKYFCGPAHANSWLARNRLLELEVKP